MSTLQELAGRKKKKWIGSAVKHPGSLTAAAQRHGRTKLQEAQAESHSKNKHIRGRGLLGLRFIKKKI